MKCSICDNQCDGKFVDPKTELSICIECAVKLLSLQIKELTKSFSILAKDLKVYHG